MGCSVTPKQSAFISEYLVDLNATQAAIRAGYSERTARSIGCALLTKHDIAAAIAEAQQKLATTAGMTIEQHMEDLKRIRDAAFDEGKFSAAATAEVARGKVAGFYVERVEVEDITDRAEVMRRKRAERLGKA